MNTQNSESQGTMRHALVVPNKGIRLETVPLPQPNDGGVIVRSTLAGICGSDLHAVEGKHPFLTRPYVPGHEAVGVVEGVPSGAGDIEPGMRVLLKPNVSCGDCLNCHEGRSNACQNLQWIGCDSTRVLSGAMAGRFVAPVRNLFRVPDSMSDETAALVECLATPVHAARIAGDLSGKRIAVLGAGTIGLLCVIAALDAGAETVVVTDVEQEKLARALRCGAAGGVIGTDVDAGEKIRSALAGPADVVFDCVANERSIEQAIGIVRRAATILVVGVPAQAQNVNLPLIQDWEIRLQGCAAYTEEDIEHSIRIAEAGGLPTSELVQSTYVLKDVSEAFSAAQEPNAGKILVRCS